MNFLRNEKKSLSIEITPLIDIVFLLVIFFVVTSKVGDSQFLELDLPETESFEYNLVKEGHEITILESGIVLINNQSFNMSNYDQIEDAILNLDKTDSIIVLSAESFSYHTWVVTMMDSLQRNGFNEIQIRTIEK
ncbi:MAG: ExbD/TolR family protein [Gammaproteobacteria bacterium]|jgi:biopolymer transport protein ExbD|uniref:Biopolymer transporter ExbD n=1 Tax=SAR86 cluster bacterium TaxID=2030880 RepID=A0A368C2X3_9GAMM|nr:MAG: biopolymer transporter ExbD [SAR86 cluster bacterium]RPG41386.1 MAG: biopolymer transporter ExbD [Gammaproteobacteria bacterium TMED186]|tara:strand:- start:92 stop:496 length:405 start_codon:yes stop_codon:yes gene_type:complete